MRVVQGEVAMCVRGHKHIVELNTSGGYTVIKSSEVIRRAALLWGWTVCNVLTRFPRRQSPIEVNLAGDIILRACAYVCVCVYVCV